MQLPTQPGPPIRQMVSEQRNPAVVVITPIKTDDTPQRGYVYIGLGRHQQVRGVRLREPGQDGAHHQLVGRPGSATIRCTARSVSNGTIGSHGVADLLTREVTYDPAAKPGVANLLTIFSALSGRSIEELVKAYEGKGYGDLKKDLSAVVADFVRPVQERTRSYLDDPPQLDKLLAIGAEKARSVASVTLRNVYDQIGFLAAAKNSWLSLLPGRAD